MRVPGRMPPPARQMTGPGSTCKGDSARFVLCLQTPLVIALHGPALHCMPRVMLAPQL